MLGLALAVARAGEPRPSPGRRPPVADGSTTRRWTSLLPTCSAPGTSSGPPPTPPAVRQLRQLYVAGSAAGTRRRARPAGYRRRGLVVEGMRTQVLALRVARAAAGRLRLEVTDRLAGAVAVGRRPAGARCPGTGQHTRGGHADARARTAGWRVAAVAAPALR